MIIFYMAGTILEVQHSAVNKKKKKKTSKVAVFQWGNSGRIYKTYSMKRDFSEILTAYSQTKTMLKDGEEIVC